MRVLTATEMKKAEENAVLAGSSYEQLMETAGQKSAGEIMRIAQAQELPHTVLMLCGKGNNAGDAFVAARYLSQAGWLVQAAMLMGEEKLSSLARYNLLRMPDTVECVSGEEANYSAAFLVDGVFGTGFAGKTLPQVVEQAFHRANRAGGVRVALDIPSGLACDTGDVAQGTFHAAYTLTFGAFKPGLLTYGSKSYAGEVILLDIGL